MAVDTRIMGHYSKERALVEAHLTEDVVALALKANRFPGVNFPWVLRQISGYQAIRRKLPSWYAQKGLEFPSSLPLEQCSSELTAHNKSRLVSEYLPAAALSQGNLHGADLTGGLGVDAWSISPLFSDYDYVERQEELCRLAEANLTLLGRKNIRVFHQSAADYLQKAGALDFVFLDPSRRDEKGRKVSFLSDCEPDVLQLLPLLREKSCLVLLKLAPMLDITRTLRQLPETVEVQVVAVDNECRELLFLLDCRAAVRLRPICRNINCRTHNPVQQFDFFFDEMGVFSPEVTPCPKAWLYEPNVALMKSGGHLLVARQYGLAKLHPNSHLYTSDNLQTDFPGRIFRLREQLNPAGKETRHRLTGGSYSVCVRNFPDNADEIRKKYRLKEDSGQFLFATTLLDGRRVLLSCERYS